MNLLKGLRHSALSQKEVPKPPCRIRRNRVELSSLSKCLLRFGDIAGAVISAGKIHPVVRRAGIEGSGAPIIVESQRQIGVFEIQLPVASQLIPAVRI